jgi:hypothetical protein
MSCGLSKRFDMTKPTIRRVTDAAANRFAARPIVACPFRERDNTAVPARMTADSDL